MTTGARDSTRHPGQEGRHPGPHRQVGEHEPGQSWWQVVCLTGVDYFSTIGYQPAIAFLAAGVVSPLATIVPILVTLFGALPVYRRVAAESPRGEGSLAMLERIPSWWSGKVLVLVLLGFLWGSGEVAQVTREVLRRAEPDRSLRPHVQVG